MDETAKKFYGNNRRYFAEFFMTKLENRNYLRNEIELANKANEEWE